MQMNIGTKMAVVIAVTMTVIPVTAQAFETAFTYQGRLEENGIPVNEPCDFIFRLYDDATAGTLLGTVNLNAVEVSGGLFTVSLDFGGIAFANGEDRWLDILVRRTSVGGDYIPLPPRQPLTPVPYATIAEGVQLPYAGSFAAAGDDYVFSVTNTNQESGKTALFVQSSNNDVLSVLGGSTGITVDTGRLDHCKGIHVYADCDHAVGINAEADGEQGRGVNGIATGVDGIGVFGWATSQDGIGVYGLATSDAAYAGYFWGDVEVDGVLTKGGGSFKIDHPLDPLNKYLCHSFVESPDMMNIYNGNVVTDASGYAQVLLPDWFEALNKDFRYQLTVLGQFAQAIVSEEIQDNRFTIMTDKPQVKVSWQVTGIRHDPFARQHPVIVEPDKPDAERGMYLYPDLYEQASSEPRKQDGSVSNDGQLNQQ